MVRHVLLITLFLTLYILRPRMPEIPRETRVPEIVFIFCLRRAALSPADA